MEWGLISASWLAFKKSFKGSKQRLSSLVALGMVRMDQAKQNTCSHSLVTAEDRQREQTEQTEQTDKQTNKG